MLYHLILVHRSLYSLQRQQWNIYFCISFFHVKTFSLICKDHLDVWLFLWYFETTSMFIHVGMCTSYFKLYGSLCLHHVLLFDMFSKNALRGTNRRNTAWFSVRMRHKARMFQEKLDKFWETRCYWTTQIFRFKLSAL